MHLSLANRICSLYSLRYLNFYLAVGRETFGLVQDFEAYLSFNPLPNDKILALSKSKAFADDKLNVT